MSFFPGCVHVPLVERLHQSSGSIHISAFFVWVLLFTAVLAFVVSLFPGEEGRRLTFRERVADKVAEFGGSLAFVSTFAAVQDNHKATHGRRTPPLCD
jgi:hypothetical protein